MEKWRFVTERTETEQELMPKLRKEEASVSFEQEWSLGVAYNGSPIPGFPPLASSLFCTGGTDFGRRALSLFIHPVSKRFEKRETMEIETSFPFLNRNALQHHYRWGRRNEIERRFERPLPLLTSSPLAHRVFSHFQMEWSSGFPEKARARSVKR